LADGVLDQRTRAIGNLDLQQQVAEERAVSAGFLDLARVVVTRVHVGGRVCIAAAYKAITFPLRVRQRCEPCRRRVQPVPPAGVSCEPVIETDTAALVARACRILGKLDLTHAALGHVSVRVGDGQSMLIKGKGPGEVGLRYTQPDDILEVDFNADKVTGRDDLQPPSESYLHIWLYRQNPGVRSVIHVHPEHAVLLTICDKPILPIYGAYGGGVRLALEGVPTYPRSVTISDDRLGQEFATCMGSHRAALMRGHGVSVVGSSVEDATVRVMELNQLATMLYKAYLLGTPRPIPDEDIAWYTRPPEANRRRGSAGGEAGVLAAWRYYRSLAGED
jgi:ribulose-5-phosphate 4-epimerase/fuculose-1-phosphate aldolase